MTVTEIKRTFEFKNGKETITLDDVNSNMSNEDVLNHYATVFPELTTAKVVDKGIVDGVNKIEFKTIAGTKG